jgi:D-alanyl-D-alanine carboxypeptidase
MRTLTLVLVLFAITFSAGQSAQPAAQNPAAMPDTPAAKQFAAWLEVFNTGDADAVRAFYDKQTPEQAARFRNIMGFRQQTGGFDFKKTLNSTPTTFTALMKERKSDQYAQAVLEVEAAAPYRIVDININAVPTPSDFAPPRMTEADAVQALKARLEADGASGNFSGAVLVAKDGKPIFTAAYGLADREKKIPNTVDTCFRLGSMNKMFTATAVMQLVQAGKIQLTDALGKYLKDYPNQDIASKVTIHMLLTHTGGTGDFFGPEFNAHRLELKTLQDYVTMFGKRGPKFEPGSQYEYSNYGFILLGNVIEKASGENYYDYVRDHIFKPAGMTSTASPPEGQATAQCAIGYTREDSKDPLRPNVDTLPYRGTSAGGGYSTVTDLLRFATALESHKLLSAENTELLTTGKVTVGPVSKYAYGFGERIVDGVRQIGHSGGAPGMNGDLEIYPHSGYVVTALANQNPPSAGVITEFIGSRLPK